MNMEAIIDRNNIAEEPFREILDIETHHNHEIIRDKEGVLRWKKNKAIAKYLKKISLNDLCPLLRALGYGKNSEVYRQLYRDMGYSLFGYWEIFYWKANNEEAKNYRPQQVCLGKKS